MNKKQQDSYKDALEGKLAQHTRVLQTQIAAKVNRNLDALDQDGEALPGADDLHIPTPESRLVMQIRYALQRIQEGTFGTCAHCEEEISPRRLAAVPWTPYCIQCQELADRHADSMK